MEDKSTVKSRVVPPAVLAHYEAKVAGLQVGTQGHDTTHACMLARFCVLHDTTHACMLARFCVCCMYEAKVAGLQTPPL